MRGWETIKLDDVAAINYGYTESAKYDPIGPHFLRITDLQDGEVDWGAVPFCKISDGDKPKYKLASGDIVFARTGATTGKSYLIDDPPDAVFASYLIRLRLKSSKLLPQFVRYFFQTATYWDIILKGTSGSAQGGFNASKLGAMEIAFPPLPEQRRIVALLDEAFEGLAIATANTEKNLKNAREVFESFVSHCFSFADDSWIEKTLAETCEMYQPKTIGTKDLVEDGAYPVFGANGVIGRYDKFNHEESQLLITCRGATCGSVNISSPKSWITGNAMVVRPLDSYLDRSFLEFIFRVWIDISKAITGSAQTQITRTNLEQLLIKFPKSVDSQRELAKQFQEAMEVSEQVKMIYRQKLAAIAELKQSLLQKAFSGELTKNFRPELEAALA